MKAVAAERRRFGYRRIHVMLERQGIVMNLKKLGRLYREENLQVRRRGGRKRGILESFNGRFRGELLRSRVADAPSPCLGGWPGTGWEHVPRGEAILSGIYCFPLRLGPCRSGQSTRKGKTPRIGGSADCDGPRPRALRPARFAGASSSTIRAPRRFKCAACQRQFSVTSGTVFASRKLAFVDLLGAICRFVNAAKDLSAVQLSRDLDVQHRRRPWPGWGRDSAGNAFVLMHKRRETMTVETREARLEGKMGEDGAVFGGPVRPAKAGDHRVDRRLLANRSGR